MKTPWPPWLQGHMSHGLALPWHGPGAPGPAAPTPPPGLSPAAARAPGPGPMGPCAFALALAKVPLAAPVAMYFHKKGIDIT